MFDRVSRRKPLKVDFFRGNFVMNEKLAKWQQLTNGESACYLCICDYEFIQFRNIDSKSIKKLFPLSSERQKFSDRNKNMIYDVLLLAFNKSAAFFIKMDDF